MLLPPGPPRPSRRPARASWGAAARPAGMGANVASPASPQDAPGSPRQPGHFASCPGLDGDMMSPAIIEYSRFHTQDSACRSCYTGDVVTRTLPSDARGHDRTARGVCCPAWGGRGGQRPQLSTRSRHSGITSSSGAHGLGMGPQ